MNEIYVIIGFEVRTWLHLTRVCIVCEVATESHLGQLQVHYLSV